VKLGVLVCDPGDRPEFVEQYKHLIRYQTRKAHTKFFVDEPKQRDCIDLVERMRKGCEYLKKVCDLTVIVENDDFYARYYFERMATLWERHGRPDLIGFSETFYYHLVTRNFVKISHPNRASLFSTCIASAAVDRIDWPKEDEAFVDLRLWTQKSLKGVAVPMAVIEAIGIKHGVGKLVSMGQRKDFHRYETDGVRDENLEWLKLHTGSQFSFYRNLSDSLKKNQNGEKGK